MLETKDLIKELLELERMADQWICQPDSGDTEAEIENMCKICRLSTELVAALKLMETLNK